MIFAKVFIKLFEKKIYFSPLVSIIIPVYNGSNYVSEAIDSALAQTYKNIEIIVVNDGSTDNTEEIVKKYGKKVRYFKKENGGVSTALNLAIKKSKGEYISWLSHDDLYYPNKIEKQILALNKISDEEKYQTILMSNFSLINEKGVKTGEWRIHRTHNLSKFKYPLYPVVKGIVNGCTLLVPKKCFDEVGLYDEKLRTSQDYDMWFRLFPCHKIVFQKDYLVKLRQHSAQGTNTINTAIIESENIWKKIISSLTEKDMCEISGSVGNFKKEMTLQMKDVGYNGVIETINKL